MHKKTDIPKRLAELEKDIGTEMTYYAAEKVGLDHICDSFLLYLRKCLSFAQFAFAQAHKKMMCSIAL